MKRPSGDQKGYGGPLLISVPAMGCAARDSSARFQSINAALAWGNEHHRVPSGEMAGMLNCGNVVCRAAR